MINEKLTNRASELKLSVLTDASSADNSVISVANKPVEIKSVEQKSDSERT